MSDSNIGQRLRQLETKVAEQERINLELQDDIRRFKAGKVDENQERLAKKAELQYVYIILCYQVKLTLASSLSKQLDDLKYERDGPRFTCISLTTH